MGNPFSKIEADSSLKVQIKQEQISVEPPPVTKWITSEIDINFNSTMSISRFRKEYKTQSKTMDGISDYMQQLAPIIEANGVDPEDIFNQHMSTFGKHPLKNPEEFVLRNASKIALQEFKDEEIQAAPTANGNALKRTAAAISSSPLTQSSRGTTSTSITSPPANKKRQAYSFSGTPIFRGKSRTTASRKPPIHYLYTGETATMVELLGIDPPNKRGSYDEMYQYQVVQQIITKGWNDYLDTVETTDSQDRKNKIFANAFAKIYGQSRVTRVYKIIALNELACKYQDLVLKRQPTKQERELLTSNKKLLAIGDYKGGNRYP